MVDAADENKLYGEELEAYCAELRAKAEEFFASAGQKNLEVYRIEQFEPILQAEEYHGKFYDGDSYVCLKNKDETAYDIHYWHGVNATADEMGSSAALTVQLSANLKLGSRHHLEEMQHESDLFLSYFKKGIFYLEGGVESGFKHVEPDVYPPKLLQVKGKRYPRVFSVPLTADSINEGDVFILDLGMRLFVWAGTEATSQEKFKAAEVAVNIKNHERKTKPSLFYPRDEGGESEAEFWEALGGQPATIRAAVPDTAPSASEDELLQYSLFHVSDATGEMKVTEIEERPLTRDMLKEEDTFLLELYDQVYVWQGRKSTTNEKRAGMKIAKNHIQIRNKPAKTRVSRIPQDIEDSHFKSFFNGFYPALKQDFGASAGLDASTHQNQDISKLHTQQHKAAEHLFNKLGANYSRTIYLLTGDLSTYEEITDPAEQGKFFAESSYVVDIKSDKHRYLICWMGNKLVGDEISKTTLAMDNICDNINTSNMTRFRIRKGREDEGFLRFFPEGFIILDEARVPISQWYEKVNEKGAMFRVQAPFGNGVRAFEQNERSASHLNSGDAYVVFLHGLHHAFAWQGLGANEHEITSARRLMGAFTTKPEIRVDAKEGEEPEEFWEAVGGKGEYASVKDHGFAPNFEPRLFNVSNSSGITFMKEVIAFTQEDLFNEDTYILDSYDTIYVWIGNMSNKFEQKGVITRAEKYIASLTDERDITETHIQEIYAGREPSHFTVQFAQWEDEIADKWLETDSKVLQQKAVVAAVEAVEEKKQQEQAAIDGRFDGFLDPKTNKFAYEDLKGKFPEGVKGDCKELYLSDAEFETIFKVTVAEFNNLKLWKQQDKKKSVELF